MFFHPQKYFSKTFPGWSTPATPPDRGEWRPQADPSLDGRHGPAPLHSAIPPAGDEGSVR